MRGYIGESDFASVDTCCGGLFFPYRGTGRFLGRFRTTNMMNKEKRRRRENMTHNERVSSNKIARTK